MEADVRRARTQLDRAGTWPLTIRYRPLPWTFPEHFEEVVSSLFWSPLPVQSLTIRGDYHRLNQIIQDMCQEVHSRLHSLELQHCKSELNAPNIIELGECLARTLPSLRHLSLRDVRCDWAHIRSLRSLRLSYTISMPPIYQPEAIASALRLCPDLELLHLNLPFWRMRGDTSELGMVSLPKLSDLFLCGPVHICAFFELYSPGMVSPPSSRLSAVILVLEGTNFSTSFRAIENALSLDTSIF